MLFSVMFLVLLSKYTCSKTIQLQNVPVCIGCLVLFSIFKNQGKAGLDYVMVD